MASINGFSVVRPGDSALGNFKIPGSPTRLKLRREVASLMIGFVRDFHRDVESLNPKSCWGHAHRKIQGSDSWSFHAPGIALDLNASDHPQGQKNTFSDNQVRTIRKLLRSYSYHGVRLFRWGADFSTTVDDMHFEIIVPRGIALKAIGNVGRARNNTAGLPQHAPGTRRLELRDQRMNGDDVEFVQRWIGERRCGAPDGFFGTKTRDGVRWYQGLRGIEVTGICDRENWKNMRIRPTF